MGTREAVWAWGGKGRRMNMRRWMTVAILAGMTTGCAWAMAGRPGEGGGGHGHGPTPGYLGVDVHDVSEDEVGPMKLKDTRGAEIVRMDHDGPAGQAGLHEHDVVVAINGQAIDGEEQLRRLLRAAMAGQSLTLTICRDGQTQTLTATLANRAEVERKAWERHLSVPLPDGEVAGPESGGPGGRATAGGMGFFHSGAGSTMLTTHGERGLLAGASNTGAMLEALSPQLAEFFGAPDGAGLLVRSVAANSPAAQGGLKAGDVVVRLNQAMVVTSADWTRMTRASKGQAVTVVVLRDKREQTLTIVPDGKHRSRLELPELRPGGRAGAGLLERGETLLAELRPRWMVGPRSM